MKLLELLLEESPQKRHMRRIRVRDRIKREGLSNMNPHRVFENRELNLRNDKTAVTNQDKHVLGLQ